MPDVVFSRSDTNSSVFVDQSVWIALVDETDNEHLTASAKIGRFPKLKLTTTQIVVELVSYRSLVLMDRDTAAARCRELFDHTRCRILRDTPTIRDLAWELYNRHEEAYGGFTVCHSLASMRMHNIDTIHTLDPRFRQLAGREYWDVDTP